MKELLDQYAEYNRWANQKLMELIGDLNQEQQHRLIASSFDSLYKTTLHMWNAEMRWYERLEQKQTGIAGAEFNGSMADLSEALQELDQRLMNWVTSKQEKILEQKISYRNSSGEQFHQPIYQLLMHLFNHNTYHRGQLVTMFRQLGIVKIPQTDFIAWSRGQLSL